MTRTFSGRHMLGVMIAFFGTVIAVNVVMAREAAHSFSGEVVENSYVASQRFNGWLAQARAQQADGWAATIAFDADHRLLVSVTRKGMPAALSSLAIEADQPLDTIRPSQPRMIADGLGRFHSEAPLPAGRWQIRVNAKGGTQMLRFEEDLPA